MSTILHENFQDQTTSKSMELISNCYFVSIYKPYSFDFYQILISSYEAKKVRMLFHQEGPIPLINQFFAWLSAKI